MNQTDRPTLLILRALGLGDILTGLPAMRALADAFPAHHRIVAAPIRFATLLRREGAADAVVDHDDLAPLHSALAGPDVAVDLHGRGPGSQPLLLALGPRRLIAFAHPDLPDTASGPQWRPGEHEVQRWCRLLAESGIPADPQRLRIRPPAGPLPSAAVGATVIHPGAASGARRWPPERFAAIARSEVSRGRPVVITGTSDERPLAETVATAASLDARCVLAGTDLDGLIRIVAVAGALVCGDTGVAHLATALGIPSVVLFGPTPPAEWGPPPNRPQHIALWTGRHGDPHAEVVDAGLLSITVAEVNNALARLPARAAPEPMLAGSPR
jgi:ADP-heptose:LPS heptosyltransferase